jgi:HD-GYP domain-containing protein (c-di-GMP phosphodiesterase class II)
MDQRSGTVWREKVVAGLLGLAGFSVFALSVAEMSWLNLVSGQVLLTVFLTGTVVLADQRPIHLGRGTKATLASLPIYLGIVLLPAPFALSAAGGGMLISNLLARTERGLLPRDIVSTVGQWTFIAFIGYHVYHLPLPALDQHLTRFILLTATALTFLIADFMIFSLTNSFILKEPFAHTLRATFLKGFDFEGIQLLVAILGAFAIAESLWALPLLAVPAITTYLAFKNIKEVRHGTLQLLEDMADTVDLRDIYTGGHSKRVADLVHQTLIAMKIYGQEAALIETAARLHDIGKISIPDHVLQKPGRLTPEETSIMQTHSKQGAALIAKYKDFSRGALMIKHHHERWDGQGYPDHLRGFDIPFGARVIAVADSFDAMTSDRPYRDALTTQQALQTLLKGCGQQWDENVVNAFVEAVSSRLSLQTSASLTGSEMSQALKNDSDAFQGAGMHPQTQGFH